MSDWINHRGVRIYIPSCESDGLYRAFVNTIDVSGPSHSWDYCYTKAQKHIDHIIAYYEENKQQQDF